MRFDDYLLRAIEQLGQMIAAIAGKLRAGALDEAEQELSDAHDALLGADRVFLEMVDTHTLANLLGSPQKVRALASLSLLEGRIARERGDDARAERLTARARALLAAAHRQEPQEGDATLLEDLAEAAAREPRS